MHLRIHNEGIDTIMYFSFQTETVQSLCSGPKNVVMLKRKEVGNPINYFDKTLAEYKEGFESKGKYLPTS